MTMTRDELLKLKSEIDQFEGSHEITIEYDKVALLVISALKYLDATEFTSLALELQKKGEVREFAKAAMQGLLSSPEVLGEMHKQMGDRRKVQEAIAILSVQHAESLIEQLNSREKK